MEGKAKAEGRESQEVKWPFEEMREKKTLEKTTTTLNERHSVCIFW